ncbi:MAG TPA: cobyric acid synthase [Candidatus Mediterraneibacter stercorigallinarum]|uniref:Cobyric acid synthase n=1 Tax=Candidatus Mediterraneibacter stercorigallinarum TaxID=2838686 RepID=A0A9D2DB29_9FIRM|nr:cobyric acid synthase [Candidatus Mediterraneibacter stercorigallinarum]
MAKPNMIQGTMSNVGKSILAGGLCRVLKQDGVKAAPFKSQNMALNSYITREGLEMGRAQVMQAEAAGIEPEVCMNPILLKPTNDTGSQVIINGKPAGVMSAVDYYRHKKDYIPSVMEAYAKLSSQYDVIVIEGAGSPAEINLKQDDIVNMGMAEMADAPVLLAGDIDRGGVFAQIAGTVMLLEEKERQRIKGTIINKFRGDVSILKPGLTMLEERTGIPVLGVVPYFYLDIDEEDSLTERFRRRDSAGLVDIAVIRLPRISNFTDFAPLESLEEVSVRYIDSPAEFGEPDAVLLPGSKNTIRDLLWMRQNGMEAKILQFADRGGLVFGICGGYQMLGQEISDPDGSEQKGTVAGMGLLPVRTVFQQEKRRTRVEGSFLHLEGILKDLSGVPFTGYEIHMGKSVLQDGGTPLAEISEEGVHRKDRSGDSAHQDGACRGNVYGCYVHGIFDAPGAAGGFLSALLRKKGYDPEEIQARDWKTYKEEQYDKLADIIRQSVDMEAVYRIIEKGNDAPCIL